MLNNHFYFTLIHQQPGSTHDDHHDGGHYDSDDHNDDNHDTGLQNDDHGDSDGHDHIGEPLNHYDHNIML